MTRSSVRCALLLSVLLVAALCAFAVADQTPPKKHKGTPASESSSVAHPKLKIKLPSRLKKVKVQLQRYYSRYRNKIQKEASRQYARVHKQARALPHKKRAAFIRSNVKALKAWQSKQVKRLQGYLKRKAGGIKAQWRRYVKRSSSKAAAKRRKSLNRVARKELKQASSIARQLKRSLRGRSKQYRRTKRQLNRKLARKARKVRKAQNRKGRKVQKARTQKARKVRKARKLARKARKASKARKARKAARSAAKKAVKRNRRSRRARAAAKRKAAAKSARRRWSRRARRQSSRRRAAKKLSSKGKKSRKHKSKSRSASARRKRTARRARRSKSKTSKAKSKARRRTSRARRSRRRRSSRARRSRRARRARRAAKKAAKTSTPAAGKTAASAPAPAVAAAQIKLAPPAIVAPGVNATVTPTNTTAPANNSATNTTTAPTLKLATVTKCIRTVSQYACCDKTNPQPCCNSASSSVTRSITPSNNHVSRPWRAHTAKWFRSHAPEACRSSACRMRFRLHNKLAAALAEKQAEGSAPVTGENAQSDDEAEKLVAQSLDEADAALNSEDAEDDDDTADSVAGSFVSVAEELNLANQERAELMGCIRVIQSCRAQPACAASLPTNMVSWIDRKRARNGLVADKVNLNPNPRRTPAEWNYAQGGKDWTGTCATGQMQSPIAIEEHRINLTTNVNEYAGNPYHLKFYYRPVVSLTITHQHAYQISVVSTIPGAMGALVSGCCTDDRYHVLGFHFHVKSEHIFPSRNKDDDGHYPLELHILHQKSGSTGDNDLLVVAIPFQIKRTPGNNKFLDSLNWQSLPRNIGDSSVLSGAVDLNDLEYSLNGDYFAYNGSLSEPSCAENVQYRVMSNPQSLSRSQLDTINAFISSNPTEFPGGRGNYRAVQPRNGRAIVLFQRHVYQTPGLHHRRAFQWIRTQPPAQGAVLKVD